jgi:hypothetical protein
MMDDHHELIGLVYRHMGQAVINHHLRWWLEM